MDSREEALRLATKMERYYERFGGQAWAEKGKLVAHEWLRLLSQDRPDLAEVRGLLETLQEGAVDGGSAWDEMHIFAKKWAREIAKD
jgi:hypothetical protein